jgi:YtfJ family uncharacterized protein
MQRLRPRGNQDILVQKDVQFDNEQKFHRRWKMKNFLRLLLLCCLVPHIAWAGIKMGHTPKNIELKGDLGGRLDGSPWESNELKGKIHVLFYVDPDEKDLNNEASEALKAEDFSRKKFQSVAIINMAATWLPNFAISSSLKKKQEQYPTTIYIRDYKKVVVNAWEISDDNSNVLAFDKKGRLIFRKDGKLNQEDIRKLIRIIRDHLDM